MKRLSLVIRELDGYYQNNKTASDGKNLKKLESGTLLVGM